MTPSTRSTCTTGTQQRRRWHHGLSMHASSMFRANYNAFERDLTFVSLEAFSETISLGKTTFMAAATPAGRPLPGVRWLRVIMFNNMHGLEYQLSGAVRSLASPTSWTPPKWALSPLWEPPAPAQGRGKALLSHTAGREAAGSLPAVSPPSHTPLRETPTPAQGRATERSPSHPTAVGWHAAQRRSGAMSPSPENSHRVVAWPWLSSYFPCMEKAHRRVWKCLPDASEDLTPAARSWDICVEWMPLRIWSSRMQGASMHGMGTRRLAAMRSASLPCARVAQRHTPHSDRCPWG